MYRVFLRTGDLVCLAALQQPCLLAWPFEDNNGFKNESIPTGLYILPWNFSFIVQPAVYNYSNECIAVRV